MCLMSSTPQLLLEIATSSSSTTWVSPRISLQTPEKSAMSWPTPTFDSVMQDSQLPVFILLASHSALRSKPLPAEMFKAAQTDVSWLEDSQDLIQDRFNQFWFHSSVVSARRTLLLLTQFTLKQTVLEITFRSVTWVSSSTVELNSLSVLQWLQLSAKRVLTTLLQLHGLNQFVQWLQLSHLFHVEAGQLSKLDLATLEPSDTWAYQPQPL